MVCFAPQPASGFISRSPVWRSARGPAAVLRRRWPLALGLAALLCCACQNGNATLDLNQPAQAAYLRLLLPKKIEIKRYLTKPVSFSNNGTPDGIEIILETQDGIGDVIKAPGTYLFELYKKRSASEDRFGERLAFWIVQVDSEESQKQYWDRQVRLYRFPVKLEKEALAPGNYILTAQLSSPTGDKLFDEYEFAQESGEAPPVTPKY